MTGSMKREHAAAPWIFIADSHGARGVRSTSLLDSLSLTLTHRKARSSPLVPVKTHFVKNLLSATKDRARRS